MNQVTKIVELQFPVNVQGEMLTEARQCLVVGHVGRHGVWIREVVVLGWGIRLQLTAFTPQEQQQLTWAMVEACDGREFSLC